jgi:hypothetical protein
VEECTRWDNRSRWISFRNPVSRWIGLRCSEISLWSVHEKNGSRLLDLVPFIHQQSNRSCMRVTIGIPAIGISRFSRTRKSRHFKSQNVRRIWTVRLRIHMAEVEVYYRESGYRHSCGQEIGEFQSKNPDKI